MNGPLYEEPLSDREIRDKQRKHVEYLGENEEKRSSNDTLAIVLGNSAVQEFAHAFGFGKKVK
ncbi:hypothetical protein PMIN06_007186 [Paraphaeosphaeria minitans]